MKPILVISAFAGALAIILGAFGAHALKSMLTVEQLQGYETAVRYQMYHVLAIFFVFSLNLLSEKYKKYIAILFLVGILFFSGSIYAITFGINPKSIWFITPLGGLLFIVGWLVLAISLFKSKK